MLEIIHNDTRVDLAAAPCPEPGSQPGGTAALILRTLLMTSPTDCSVTHLTPIAVKKKKTHIMDLGVPCVILT